MITTATRRARFGTAAFLGACALTPLVAFLTVGGGASETLANLVSDASIAIGLGLAIGLIGSVPWFVVLECIYRKRPQAGPSLVPIVTGGAVGVLAGSAALWGLFLWAILNMRIDL